MTHRTSNRLLIAACVSLASVAAACGSGNSPAQQEKPPGGTLAGGPYKLVATDLTGDGKIDLALAYLQVGAVSIEQGDGKGEFSTIQTLAGAPASAEDPKDVSNITSGDIDHDGLPD